MKRQTERRASIAPKPRQRLVIMWGIRLIGLTMACAIALSVLGMISILPSMFRNGVTLDSCRYITFVSFNTVLSLAIAWHFNRFIWDVSEYAEVFSRDQSERLISLAFLHLCMFVIRLIAPTLEAPASSMPWFQPDAVRPEADLHLLMFAAMFFALAGVFEYGRMLKKDSDSIV